MILNVNSVRSVCVVLLLNLFVVRLFFGMVKVSNLKLCMMVMSVIEIVLCCVGVV